MDILARSNFNQSLVQNYSADNQQYRASQANGNFILTEDRRSSYGARPINEPMIGNSSMNNGSGEYYVAGNGLNSTNRQSTYN